MARNPVIFEQIFRAGDGCSGVVFTGTVGTQSADGYLYRQEPDPLDPAVDGGLLPTASFVGDSAYRLLGGGYIFLDTATQIDVIIIDPDGIEVVVQSVAAEVLAWNRSDLFPVLPEATVKVVATLPGGIVGPNGGKILLVVDTWFAPGYQ